MKKAASRIICRAQWALSIAPYAVQLQAAQYASLLAPYGLWFTALRIAA